MTRSESINKHRTYRNDHEKDTLTKVNKWFYTYRPGQNVSISVNEDEWGKVDCTINGIQTELKCRWCKPEQIEKYRKEGWVVSVDKCKDDEKGKTFEVLMYFLDNANECMTITHKKIDKGIYDGNITTSTRMVNEYQYAPELGQKEETLYFIPDDYFTHWPLDLT